MLEKIISGGQTGVDRVALDVAMKFSFPYGGCCPKGRRAEDGMIPEKYLLQETTSEDYGQRTKLNIKGSDGTLVLVPSLPVTISDGTILTISEVQAQQKPYLIVDLSKKQDINPIIEWIKGSNIQRLNIAGPRES